MTSSIIEYKTTSRIGAVIYLLATLCGVENKFNDVDLKFLDHILGFIKDSSKTILLVIQVVVFLIKPLMCDGLTFIIHPTPVVCVAI